MAKRSLEFQITAESRGLRRGLNEAQAGLRGLETESMRVSGRVSQATRRMEQSLKLVGVAAAGAVAGGLTYSVKKAADFESQLSSLGAVAETNARQMDMLRKQAIKAGAATKYSALEAAQAQTELAKGGLSVSQIMKGGLTSSLALAAAGEMDLAEAAATTVNAMKLFGLRGRDSMQVADGLAKAANATTADVSDFAMALSQGGSAAKASGLDFRETTVALEALAEIGIKGSDAGTSLKSMLVGLAAPTDAASRAAAGLNLKFFDSEGKMKSLADISRMLRDRFSGMSEEQRLLNVKTLVGTDGMRALLALYDAGPKKLKRFEDGLKEQGTAADVAKKKQDNLKGSIEQLQGAGETLGISVGTLMIPMVRKGADELRELATGINRVVENDSLSLGEKLEKSFDLAKVQAGPWVDKLKKEIDDADLPKKLSDGINEAVPAIIEKAAQAAPKAAKAFAEAWMDSGILTRAILGGWLLSKVGGFKAFGALGRQQGSAAAIGYRQAFAAGTVGTGVAAGGGRAAAGGAAAAGARGAGRFAGLRTAGAGAAAAFGGPVGIGAATAVLLGPELVKPFLADTKSMEDGLGELVDKAKKAAGPGGMGALRKELLKLARDGSSTASSIDRDLNKKLEDLAKRAKGFQAIGREGVFIRIDSSVTEEGAAAVDNAFKAMRRRAGSSMESITTQVRFGSRAIKRNLGENTEEGKAALARNFTLAARAVKRSMKEGVISTEEGTAEINRLMRKALGQFGITGKSATRYLNGQDTVTGKRDSSDKEYVGGFAGGGWIGARGQRGADTVPIVVGAGEAVLNRHQQAVVEGMLGNGFLDHLFSTVQTPHYMAKGGIVRGGDGASIGQHFAKGGIVPVPGFPGERAASTILPKIAGLTGRFPGLRLTDAFGPGHKSPGHTVTGTAADFAGPDAVMDAAVKMLVRKGYKVLYDGRFGSTAWPGHGPSSVAGGNAHLHVEFGGGGGGAISAAVFKALKAPKWNGPGGAIGAMGKAGLKAVTAGANAKLRKAAESVGGDGATGGGATSAGGKFNRSQLERLWIQAGGPRKLARTAAAIALAESGGNPNANYSGLGGPNTGPTGLWQIYGMPPGVKGDLRNPAVNARAAVAKWRGAGGFTPWTVYTGHDPITGLNTKTYLKYMARGGFAGHRFATGGRPKLVSSKAQKTTKSSGVLSASGQSPVSSGVAGTPVQRVQARIAAIDRRLAGGGLSPRQRVQLQQERTQLRTVWLPAARKQQRGKAPWQPGEDIGTDVPENDTPFDIYGQVGSRLELQARAGLFDDPATAFDETDSVLTQRRIDTANAALRGEYGALSGDQTLQVMADLRDAMKAQTEAAAAQTQALNDYRKELTEEMQKTRESYEAVGAVTKNEAVRALADVFSGELGGRYMARTRTPGTPDISASY